jgi:hypothetical protein
VTAVAVDPSNTQNVYVGTQRAGVGKSIDGGNTWMFGVGGTGSLPVNDIELAPGAPATIYLGMGSVAVFKSTNAGAAFNASAAGIRQLNVSSIAVNPANPAEMALSYSGQNDGGIFESTDAGQSWHASQAPLPRWTKLLFDHDGVLYATHDGPLGRADDGVWKRQGDGTWTDLGPGSPSQLDTLGLTIAVSTTSPKVVFFGGQEGFFGGSDSVIWTYNLGGSGIWVKQYEGGIPSEQVDSFALLNGGAGPVAVASIVNFGQETGAAGGILRSSNFGDTWARSETGYPAAWHGWGLDNRVSQPNTVYVSSSANTGTMPAGIYKSIDGGQSWQPRGLSNPTFRSFLADPLATNTLYGVEVFAARPYRSVDDGASFQSFDAGLPSGSGANELFYGGHYRPRLFLGGSVGAYVMNLPRPCFADFNGQGGVTVQDIFDFLSAFFSNSVLADVNESGAVTVQDVFDYLAAYFGGC